MQHRDRVNSGRNDDGGVLVAVRIELYAYWVAVPPGAPYPLSPLIDHVLVELRSRSYCYVLSAVYIPPATLSDAYETYLHYLTFILQFSNIINYILMGDYNLPEIEWEDCNTHAMPCLVSNYTFSSKVFIDFMSLLGCFPYNKFKNRNGRLLDLCLTDIAYCKSMQPTLSLVPPDANHPLFYIIITTSNNSLNIY